MGAPTPSIPQNPTNQPMQQPQMGGKGGGGKGASRQMSGYGQDTPPVSQANSFEMMDQGYRSNFQNQQTTQPQSGNGKSIAGNAPNPNQLTPDGGNMTLSANSGQPQMGQPNRYANTTGSWDNSSIQRPPTMPQMGGGKGKGA